MGGTWQNAAPLIGTKSKFEVTDGWVVCELKAVVSYVIATPVDHNCFARPIVDDDSFESPFWKKERKSLLTCYIIWNKLLRSYTQIRKNSMCDCCAIGLWKQAIGSLEVYLHHHSLYISLRPREQMRFEQPAKSCNSSNKSNKAYVAQEEYALCTSDRK